MTRSTEAHSPAKRRDQRYAPWFPLSEKPATEKQLVYLAGLQERLGEPFSGQGLTAEQASAAISRCLRALKQPEVAYLTCPRCQAPPNQPCVDRAGRERQRVHASRVRKGAAFRAAKRAG